MKKNKHKPIATRSLPSNQDSKYLTVSQAQVATYTLTKANTLSLLYLLFALWAGPSIKEQEVIPLTKSQTWLLLMIIPILILTWEAKRYYDLGMLTIFYRRKNPTQAVEFIEKKLTTASRIPAPNKQIAFRQQAHTERTKGHKQAATHVRVYKKITSVIQDLLSIAARFTQKILADQLKTIADLQAKIVAYQRQKETSATKDKEREKEKVIKPIKSNKSTHLILSNTASLIINDAPKVNVTERDKKDDIEDKKHSNSEDAVAYIPNTHTTLTVFEKKPSEQDLELHQMKDDITQIKNILILMSKEKPTVLVTEEKSSSNNDQVLTAVKSFETVCQGLQQQVELLNSRLADADKKIDLPSIEQENFDKISTDLAKNVGDLIESTRHVVALYKLHDKLADFRRDNVNTHSDKAVRAGDEILNLLQKLTPPQSESAPRFSR